MAVPGDFRTDVRDWIALDDKVSNAKKVIEKVKHKKNEISENIVNFMKTKGLEKKEIKISDSRLKCSTVTKTTPLTKNFVIGCLTEKFRNHQMAKELADILYNPKERMRIVLTDYFEDEEKANNAVEYIFSKREKTVLTTLRRKVQRTPVTVDEGPASENAQNAMRTPHESEYSD